MSYQTFHNFYLELIKKILKASFVGWQEEKGKKSLRVVVNKKEHIIPFEGNVTQGTYEDLITKLTTEDV